MPVELWSYIVDPGDGTIKMAHVFYGQTEEEAQTYYGEHLSHCKYMQEANKEKGEGELIDEVVEVAALPRPEDFEDGEEDEDEEPEEDEDEEPEEV